MSDINPLKRSVESLQWQKQNIIDRLKNAEKALAEAMCPLSVGDVVTICGYTHKGKKGVVKAITYKKPFLREGHSWNVTVGVCKSNGDVGQLEGEFDENDWRRAND